MKETAVFMNMCRVIDPEGRWLLRTVSDAKARARLGYRPVLSREEGLANLADREMLVR